MNSRLSHNISELILLITDYLTRGNSERGEKLKVKATEKKMLTEKETK